MRWITRRIRMRRLRIKRAGRSSHLRELGLWCLVIIALDLIMAFPHELSHFLVAGVLGYEADIVFFLFIPHAVEVSITSEFHIALISFAGGIGGATFLYFFWRAIGCRATMAFVFYIPMQLCYAVFEVAYHLGQGSIPQDMALMCCWPGIIGMGLYNRSLRRRDGG